MFAKGVVDVKKAVSKTDIIIYVAVVLAAIISFASTFAFSADNGFARSVRVKTDNGESVYPLSENKTFDIFSNGISLTVEISDGAVCVTSATCPDKCCVNTGAIMAAGKSIVCLPARVTLTLDGEGGVYDANAG